MRSKAPLAGCALFVLLALPAIAAREQWLHVRVEERGARGETVRVNLPLAAIESIVPLIPVDALERGSLQLDDDGRLGGLDLRELAAALRDTPDGDFVTVKSDDETVRVAKEGDLLVVRVEESGRRSERVHVRLPLAVLEALVGGDRERLDLGAAIRALAAHAGQALVDVESDDELVRVWIDSSESGDSWPGANP